MDYMQNVTRCLNDRNVNLLYGILYKKNNVLSFKKKKEMQDTNQPDRGPILILSWVKQII